MAINFSRCRTMLNQGIVEKFMKRHVTCFKEFWVVGIHLCINLVINKNINVIYIYIYIGRPCLLCVNVNDVIFD